MAADARCSSPHISKGVTLNTIQRHMQNAPKTPCPKCHSRDLKPWTDLDRDEQIAAEAHPSKHTPTQRKKHRICTRCWFEEAEAKIDFA